MREGEAGRCIARTSGGRQLGGTGSVAVGVFGDVGEFEIIGGCVGPINKVIAREDAVAGWMIHRAEEETLAAIHLIGAKRAEENDALLPEGDIGRGLIIFGGGVAEGGGVVTIGAENPERIVGTRGARGGIDESDFLHLSEVTLRLVPVVAVAECLRASTGDQTPGARIGIDRNHVVFARLEDLLIFGGANNVSLKIEPARALRICRSEA